MSTRTAVPRRTNTASGHATIRPVTVEIIFQRCPGTQSSLGIRGLDYEIRVGQAQPTRGTTGSDGKITIQMPPGATAMLQVMGTIYEVSVRGALEPVSVTDGIQRRLQMLGYYQPPVSGMMDETTEYALLNFQADNGPLRVDGLPVANVQTRLRNVVGE